MQVGHPRGRRLRAGVRGALAAAVAAVALAGAFTTARAARTGEPPPVAFESIPGVPDEWTALLNGYVVDPKTYGPRLIALEREGGAAGLPPMFQMAIGDAYLRAGNRRAAEAVFEQTLAQNFGPPYGEFANLGIGMIRMVGGDEDGALDSFVRVAESEEVGAQALGNLGMGAALSASGRFAEAQEAFAETAAISNVDDDVRQAGRFGSAMALFGAGDFAAAARAFDEIAKLDPDGTVGQDARYAAARARLEMGDREGGAAALRELVGSCPERGTSRRAPRALRNLDARAMGRIWLRNYRTTGWNAVASRGGSMYSIGGCALARSTLRAVERNDASLTTVRKVAAPAAVAPAMAAPASAAGGLRPTAPEAAPTAATGSSWSGIAVLAVGLALAAVAWVVVTRVRKVG